ncbi:PWWP domain-containing protein 2A-like isoform X2 [Corticium candelabrum]|nr:PWWP domain-containing protein 2A-like isoform X2 [Corticium candelabrum]XP_062518205.1 PWWP domain-containing protein 2A-like isoform X2 [Corticium candelabrum]
MQPVRTSTTRRDTLPHINTYKSHFKGETGDKRAIHKRISSNLKEKRRQENGEKKRKIRQSSTHLNQMSSCDVAQGILDKNKRRQSDGHDGVKAKATKQNEIASNSGLDCSRIDGLHPMNDETVDSCTSTGSEMVNATKKIASFAYPLPHSDCYRSQSERQVSMYTMIQPTPSIPPFAYPYLGCIAPLQSSTFPHPGFSHLPNFMAYGIWNTNHEMTTEINPGFQDKIVSPVEDKQKSVAPHRDVHYPPSPNSLHQLDRPPSIDTPTDNCNDSDEEQRYQSDGDLEQRMSTRVGENTDKNQSFIPDPLDDKTSSRSQSLQQEENKSNSKREAKLNQKWIETRKAHQRRELSSKEAKKNISTRLTPNMTKRKKPIAQTKRLVRARIRTATTEEDAALFEALWISKQEQNFDKKQTVKPSPRPPVPTARKKRVYGNPEFFYSPRPSSSRSKCANDDVPRYKIDDIVWAKLVSRPWWPAKVLSFSKDDGHSMYDVSVQWLGKSSNCTDVLPSSLICPFSENFDEHYLPNKTKSTYVKAVRDALQKSELEVNRFTRLSDQRH